MTETISKRDELVEAITREVLATLGSDAAAGTGATADPCASCQRACAAQCAPKVRDVVAGGASRVEYHGRAADVPGDLARYIDHTLLRPDASAADIDRLCAEAAEYRFAAVCINPTWVGRAAENLRGTDVAVASVIGFPFGAATSEVKALEARRAIRDGAREIDMVINIGALKSGNHAQVLKDVRAVVEVCKDGRAASKVILETALLTDEEKTLGCEIAMKAGADFVKTSTGFSSGGATAEDVALMSRTVAPRKLGVKAAGGVRTYADVVRMVEAGATRVGCSSSVKIMEEASALAGTKE
jgi:deoxyribose-phosphate aldolase